MVFHHTFICIFIFSFDMFIITQVSSFVNLFNLYFSTMFHILNGFSKSYNQAKDHFNCKSECSLYFECLYPIKLQLYYPEKLSLKINDKFKTFFHSSLVLLLLGIQHFFFNFKMYSAKNT